MNIRALYAICLMFAAYACVAQGAEPEKLKMEITKKDRILADLLSGEWIENPYFSTEDLSYLKLTKFCSNWAITDAAFTETIYDPKHFEVRRTYFDFSGRPSNTEIVALPADEFWFRVKYLQRQLEKSSGQPILSIELPLKESLQVLRRSDVQ